MSSVQLCGDDRLGYEQLHVICFRRMGHATSHSSQVARRYVRMSLYALGGRACCFVCICCFAVAVRKTDELHLPIQCSLHGQFSIVDCTCCCGIAFSAS